MKRTRETLETLVRETPLLERLEQSRKRIGAMCSERRGPRMCIPVEHTDDDFFIDITLKDAVNTFDQAREALKSSLNYLMNTQRSLGIEVGSDDELDSTKLCRSALAAMEAAHEL